MDSRDAWRTLWYRRLAALVVLLSLVLGTQALLASIAGAAGFVPISGSGSIWSSTALDLWRPGGKDRSLSEFGHYARCEGQQAEPRGYSPVPVDVGQLTLCAIGTGSTVPTATATTLEVSRSSPSGANTVETLTATISPPGVAGFVQFRDGAGAIGGPVDVSGGSASTTTALAPGTHSLIAVFTPTDLTALRGSTSGAVAAVVSAPLGAKPTATTFMVTPSGPVIQGTPVILVAQVAPANATGTIQFMDGDTELGVPCPVFGGFALTVTSRLAKGTHSLSAAFTASNQGVFGPSTALTLLLTVTGLS